MVRVGLNGFGRIGRVFTRIAETEFKDQIEIVGINTRKTKPDMLAYLLKYDSVFGRFGLETHAKEDAIVINGKRIRAFNESDPANIPWDQVGAQIVVDATGAFKTKEELSKHLKNGVERVLLSAPAKDDMKTVVLGSSDPEDYKNHQIISNASCTTNCTSPILQVLHHTFRVESAFITTAHAYTGSQPLTDESNKKFTRSRAAALSIVPTTTGAADAVVKVIPELQGKIDAMAIRVPVPNGSFIDVSAMLSRETTVQDLHNTFKHFSETTLKGILGYEEDPIVSADVKGSTFSSIYDANYTKVVNGRMVKICAWYDNEWGYSQRLVELVNSFRV